MAKIIIQTIVLFIVYFIGVQAGRTIEAQDIEAGFSEMKEQMSKNWMSCERK